jgi:hypothetical protein
MCVWRSIRPGIKVKRRCGGDRSDAIAVNQDDGVGDRLARLIDHRTGANRLGRRDRVGR